MTATTLPMPKRRAKGDVVGIATGGEPIVVADKGLDRVNIAALGGDGGTYVRAARRNVERVALADLPKLLQEATRR